MTNMVKLDFAGWPQLGLRDGIATPVMEQLMQQLLSSIYLYNLKLTTTLLMQGKQEEAQNLFKVCIAGRYENALKYTFKRNFNMYMCLNDTKNQNI